jgi:ubiquinone biosynthesis protein
MASGVGQTLDREFGIVDKLPFRAFLSISRADRERLRATLRTWQRAGYRTLPSDVEEIAAKLKSELPFPHHEDWPLTLEIDRSSNRLAFAAIVAALVIGSSLLVHLRQGPELFGISVLGLAGYNCGALGLWLVIAILRSGI